MQDIRCGGFSLLCGYMPPGNRLAPVELLVFNLILNLLKKFPVGVNMGDAKQVFFRDLIMVHLVSTLSEDNVYIRHTNMTGHPLN